MTALEPLYTLQQAAELIPMPSVNALRVWLHRHREDYPGRYRRTGHGSTVIRMLYASEVRKIQAWFLVSSTKRAEA